MKADEFLILVERLLSAAVEWNDLDHGYRDTWHELAWLKSHVEAHVRALPPDAVAQLRSLTERGDP